MTHYYGLDYGSTTSLLYECVDGKPNLLKRLLSATKVSNGRIVASGERRDLEAADGYLVKSPKREFIENHSSEYNGVPCKSMIQNTMEKFFEGKGNEMEDCHITLTVPNSYTSADYIEVHNILLQAIRKVAPNIPFSKIHIHILPEPVAAALYYIHCCMAHGDFENKHLVVCDIGGGTTDISIVTCSRQKGVLTFNVEKNQQSDKYLGGEDFTKSLCTLLGRSYSNITAEEWKNIEILKIRLSSHEKDKVGDFICDRKTFNNVAIGALLERLGKLLDRLRKKCGIPVDEKWVILRVGGSCRIPKVQKLLKEKFPEIKDKQNFEAEPDDIFYSVAQGAAIYSAQCGGSLANQIVLRNSVPQTIYYINFDGERREIVPQNSPDGLYSSQELCLVGAEVYKDGTYDVGDIMIVEEGDEPRCWPKDSRKRFKLEGRKVEDIRLKLNIEIKNSRIYSCSIIDLGTGDKNILEIGKNALQK